MELKTENKQWFGCQMNFLRVVSLIETVIWIVKIFIKNWQTFKQLVTKKQNIEIKLLTDEPPTHRLFLPSIS